MKVTLLAFLLLSVLLLSCDKDEEVLNFPLDKADQLQEDDYQIYSAILANYNLEAIIVRQQTTTLTMPEERFSEWFVLDKMKNMEPDLYQNFVNENSQAYFLDEKIEIPEKPVWLISNAEYAYYFDRSDKNHGWQLLISRYPQSDGYHFAFNKIGYNDAKTQAFVGKEAYWLLGGSDNPTAKIGKVFYLEKIDGSWQIIGAESYPL